MSQGSTKAKRGTYLVNEISNKVPNYDFSSWIEAHYAEETCERTRYNSFASAIQEYNNLKPIALLPLRIETKFIGSELWIRIFPDQIFLKTLEKALTTDEHLDGQDYWSKYVAANGQVDEQREAWRFLCSKYGVTRSAWIIRTLFPTNLVSETQSSNVASALSRLDIIRETVNTNFSNYVAPDAVIDYMNSANNEIGKINQNLSSSFRLKNSGIALLNATNGFVQRIFQSKYDAKINPFVDSSANVRVDEALLDGWLQIKKSFKKAKLLISYGSVGNPVHSRINNLLSEIERHKTGRSKYKESSDLLNRFSLELHEILTVARGETLDEEKWINILKDLSSFKGEFLKYYELLNPLIDITNPHRGRVDQDIEQYKDKVLLRYSKFSLEFSSVLIDFSSPALDLISIFEFIYGFDINGKNSSDFRQFLADLNVDFQTVLNSYLSHPLTDLNDVIAIYGLICDLSNLYQRKYDIEINPFLVLGEVFSGRTDASLEIYRIAFEDLIRDFKDELIASSRSAEFVQDSDSLRVMTDYLSDKNAVVGNKKFIKNCSAKLEHLESNLSSYTRNSTEEQVLILEVLNFFSKFVVVYESAINPPKIEGFPSEGGQDKNLDGDYALLILNYRKYINSLIGTGTLSDSFNLLMQTHGLCLGYNIVYTRPSVVSEEFSALKTLADELKNSLIDVRFNESEREWFFASAEELSNDINLKFEQSYNPAIDVLDEGKGFRNTSLESSRDDLLSALQECLSTQDSTIAGEEIDEFSFQFSGPLVFPNVDIKEGDWTVQEYSDILPTRFVAIGFDEKDAPIEIEGEGEPDDNEVEINEQDYIKFIQFGNPVDQTIKFGFNPNISDNDSDFDVQGTEDENGNTHLQFGDSLSWLTDKVIAREKGMAIQVPIGDATYFSKIIVVGVKEDIVDISQHEELMKDLILNHQYTKGVSLLSVGTPTNNTSDTLSGYNQNDVLFEESFGTFAQDRLYAPTSDKNRITDGQYFAEFLGLPYSSAFHIQGANNVSITNGHIGARVLFPGTIGLHMEEILDNLLNSDNRKRIKKFFEDHVSARGLSPALRIGNQPYGLLITSNLQNYQVRNESSFKSIEDFFSFQDPNDASNEDYPVFNKNVIESDQYYSNVEFSISVKDVKTTVFTESQWQLRFLKRLKQVLVFLDGEWRKVAENHSKNVYLDNIEFHRNKLEQEIIAWENSEGNSTLSSEQQIYLNDFAQNHLFSIIGHLPYSYDLGVRYAINSGSWYNASQIEGLGNLLNEAGLLQNIETPPTNPYWFSRMSARMSASTQPNGYSALANFMNYNLEKGIYTGFDYSTLNGPTKNDILNFANDGLEEKIKYTRAFLTTNALETIRLNGALISANSNDKANGNNGYINWILNPDNFETLCGNDFSSMPSSAILFMLARASFLGKSRELAMKMVIQEKLANWPQLMALGTAENALNSYIKITHYGNFAPYCGLGASDNSNIQTYLRENAWKFTKWNILLAKFYKDTPYLIGSRDLYDVFYAPSLEQKVLNFGDIIAYQLESIEDIADIQYPWIKSRLLKFLSPPVVEEDGIFGVSGNETNLRTISDFLLNPGLAYGVYSNYSVKKEFSDYKNDLKYLSNLSQEQLEQITAECIDLSSNRLDAWIHGLFGLRLKEIRNRTSSFNINSPGINFSKGSYIGAYGYVENLSKRDSMESNTNLSPTDLSNIPQELASLIPQDAQVYIDNQSYGFLPTPSLSHAVTAAILNSTYQSSRIHESSQVYNRASVNLSSSRIRSALFLIEGIQAGNDLGALLGQQFENGLHEASISGEINLDLTIHRLRKLYPMRSVSGAQITSGENSLIQPISGEVLNGISILDKIKEIYQSSLVPNSSLYETIQANLNALFELNGTLPDDGQGEPSMFEALQSNLSVDELKVMAFHIDQMAQSLDALGDLVITEGVYQIASGNHQRAAAAMGMMDGSSGLIEPEVIQSPYKADQFTNRILMNYPVVSEIVQEFSANDVIQDGWSTGGVAYKNSPRAALDQSLNMWLGNLSIPAHQIILNFAFLDPGNEEETISSMSLAQLNLQPLDLISYVTPESTNPTSEFSKILIYYFRKHTNLSEHAQCRLIFDSTDSTDGLISFQEAYPLFCQWKEMLLNCKSISAHDFSHEGNDSKNLGYVISDLKNRVNSLVNYSNSLATELQSIVAFDIEMAGLSDLEDWINSLEKVMKLGISGVLPQSSFIPEDTEDFNLFRDKISALCEVALTLLSDRINKSSELVNAWNSADEENHQRVLNLGTSIVEVILGGKTFFYPLLKFEVPNVENTNPLNDAIQYSEQLVTEIELGQLERWIHANGMVRKNISNLINLQVNYEITSQLQAITEPSSVLDLNPVQLPHDANATWIASENIPDSSIHGKCNLLLNSLNAIDIQDLLEPQPLKSFTLTGFKLDEWNEAVPSQEVTAGLAAHINQPDAESPQTILLSVPCSEEQGWKWNLNDLVMSISQAFDMAKYRSVESEHLGQKLSEDSDVSFLSKIFPANMVDVFPTHAPGNESTPAHEYDGIRPNFNYGENNN